MRLILRFARFIAVSLVVCASAQAIATEVGMSDADVSRLYADLLQKHSNSQLRDALREHTKSKPSLEAKRGVLMGDIALPLTVTTLASAKDGAKGTASTMNPCRVKCRKVFTVKCKPPRNPRIWDVNSCEESVVISEPCDVVCDGVELK